MHTVENRVALGAKTFTYQLPWDGARLALPKACPYLAFDTETDCVELTTTIPRLALASISSGGQHAILHPGQIADFIVVHADARFIGHHVAFDFWVIDEHLRLRGETQARDAWRNICHDNRLRDSMLLDMLLRLAEGRDKGKSGSKDWLPPRSLEEVAATYTSLRVSKADDHRSRYGEIIDADWETLDPGFFEYAVKDAIVTYRAYLGMTSAAELLMREHGYHSTQSLDDRHTIRPDAVAKFGLLSEAVQIKGAVALAQVTRNGMHLDAVRKDELRDEYRQRLEAVVGDLLRDYPTTVKRHRNGTIQRSAKSGAPAMYENVVRGFLEKAALDIAGRTGKKVEVPRTPGGKVSTSAKLWTDYADQHPFVQLWTEREQASKRCEFFGKLQGAVVHPHYNVLLRTGRTSCEKPNVQQMPREGGFRELFVPSPGCLLLAVDYSFIELRTLAAVCEAKFGHSQLADTIRAGVDPHCYTAAILLNTPLEEFLALKDGKEEQAQRYKRHRQNAKAVNFGVPGGLGARSLVSYAHSNFGVTLTLEQATQMRQKLVAEVYPEQNPTDGYLADDGMQRLARSLKVSAAECWKRLDWKGTRDACVVRCVEKIVRGRPTKVDGTPYRASFTRDVWDGLNDVNHNGDPRLVELLESCEGGEELYQLLFRQDVTTLTGRIRGNVEYTQAKNTPFQSLAADGAKLALWELLYRGYRVVGFIHDELLVELPNRGGFVERSMCEEIVRIVCNAMAQVTGRIPIAAEYTVATCWSKEAKLLANGDKVLAWSPKKK